MDTKKIIQQGEEAKVMITITRTGFVMNDDDFKVKLMWGLMGQSITITKDQMFSNDDDEWFFVFDSSPMIGPITAECTYYVPDNDYPDKLRTEVNRQFLCFVVTSPLPRFICCPALPSTTGTVSYEFTNESDVAELYAYLTDSHGRNLITAENERLMVLKK